MPSFNGFVEKIEHLVCTATFAVMLFLTFVNVLSRFLLHMSLSFSEEIVTSLFVLASLAGASIAIRDRAHLGLDYFTSVASYTKQKFLAIVANVLGILMCCIIFYFGVYMVMGEYSSNQLSATMQWPEWIYGMTVPVGVGLLIYRYIYSIFEIVSGRDINFQEAGEAK
ncbi:TRAP transporter small permease [uncultured Cohaesibacter sp.]|uniref:TRAP transporter small permease n=1 Tax=uncultured Cohaesibacter sp. TaxID=1002546 RepID=UPI0029C897AB|nr:TRAP transporter small permease [uncultured Cohaesibacter sp.]